MIKKIRNRRPVVFHNDSYGIDNNIVDDNLASTSLVIEYYDRDDKIKEAIRDLGTSVNEILVHCMGWPCMTKSEAINRRQWLQKLGLHSARVIIDTQLLVTNEDESWKCHVLPPDWRYRFKSTYDIIS